MQTSDKLGGFGLYDWILNLDWWATGLVTLAICWGSVMLARLLIERRSFSPQEQWFSFFPGFFFPCLAISLLFHTFKGHLSGIDIAPHFGIYLLVGLLLLRWYLTKQERERERDFGQYPLSPIEHLAASKWAFDVVAFTLLGYVFFVAFVGNFAGRWDLPNVLLRLLAVFALAAWYSTMKKDANRDTHPHS